MASDILFEIIRSHRHTKRLINVAESGQIISSISSAIGVSLQFFSHTPGRYMNIYQLTSLPMICLPSSTILLCNTISMFAISCSMLQVANVEITNFEPLFLGGKLKAVNISSESSSLFHIRPVSSPTSSPLVLTILIPDPEPTMTLLNTVQGSHILLLSLLPLWCYSCLALHLLTTV